MRPIFLMLLELALSGFASNVARHSVLYNKGLASSGNELLLANVLRSAKGHPLYFSDLGQYTGADTMNASLSASIPVGADAPRSYTFSPTIGISSAQSAAVNHLETDKFTRGMLSPIRTTDFLFLTQGRYRANLELSLIMLPSYVSFTEKEYSFVINELRTLCLNPQDATTRSACSNMARVEFDLGCGPMEGWGDRVTSPEGQRSVVFNVTIDARNPCTFGRTHVVLQAPALMAPHFEPLPGATSAAPKAPPAAAGAAQASPPATSNPEARYRITVQSVQIGRERSLMAGLALPSPSEMIHFLGQIVAAEMRSDGMRCGTNVPQVTAPDGQAWPLFCLLPGGRTRSSVAAVQFEGRTYAVPPSTFGGGPGYPSLQTLALLKDILNLYKSREDVANTNVVVFQ